MSGTDRDRAWGRALTLSFRKLATYCWRVLWWSSDLGGLTPVPDPKRLFLIKKIATTPITPSVIAPQVLA